MGLSLTVAMILQPLKNVRLVILALLANFVLVPLLAYLIILIVPLEQSLRIGLAVLATAAGAPFLPKLVQGAKGNVAFGVGLMVLLMVVTIIYMPLVLPLLLTGVSVNPWDIAKSLIVLMLVPLALGLLIKSHSPDTAAHWQPVMAKISSLAILVLLVVGLGLNVSNIIALIGTGGLLALLLFIVGSLLIGLLLGGRDAGQPQRDGTGHGPAQCVGRPRRDRAELLRHEHAAVRAGRRHPPAADPAADGKTSGRARAGGRTGCTAAGANNVSPIALVTSGRTTLARRTHRTRAQSATEQAQSYIIWRL